MYQDMGLTYPYCCIHLKDNDCVTVNMSLKDLSDLIKSKVFDSGEGSK